MRLVTMHSRACGSCTSFWWSQSYASQPGRTELPITLFEGLQWYLTIRMGALLVLHVSCHVDGSAAYSPNLVLLLYHSRDAIRSYACRSLSGDMNEAWQQFLYYLSQPSFFVVPWHWSISTSNILSTRMTVSVHTANAKKTKYRHGKDTFFCL